MARAARKNTIMGNSQKNMNSEFPETKIGRSPGFDKSDIKRKNQKTAAEMGSRPVQEKDTGPTDIGPRLMTATGPKRRLGKAVTSNQKKYGTRVGTGSVSARKPSGKK